MAWPYYAATTGDAGAASAMQSAASASGLDVSTLGPMGQVQLIVANLLRSDPTTVAVPAGDVEAGTFGANTGTPTGAYTFVGTLNFQGLFRSTTALATPSALAATALNSFASTVSGGVLMGFGTTGDVTLKNRAGTDVAYVGANATTFNVVSAGVINTISGSLIGTSTADNFVLQSGNVNRWILSRTTATSELVSAQVTARIIGGSTNGLAIRDSTNARDNFVISDAGDVAILNNGTGSGRAEISTTSGELTTGYWMGATAAGYDTWIRPNTSATAGRKAGITYNNNTQNYSAVEVAHVASGFGTLDLMKSGGTLRIGTTGLIVAAATGNISTYRSVATAGWGVPAIQADGGSAGNVNTRSAAAATYTVGAADGTFVVSGAILINTGTAFSMSLDCVYTDAGNVSRTLVLPLTQLAGTFVVTGLATNVVGTGPYESVSMTIRCKTGTTITIRPSVGGTYTTVNYDVYANIRQVA